MQHTLRPTALVVEDDADQRELVSALLEECDMTVIQCESAESAEVVLERVGGNLSMIFADVNLAGDMTGTELAVLAKSMKEGQYYMTPLYLVALPLIFLTLMPLSSAASGLPPTTRIL